MLEPPPVPRLHIAMFTIFRGGQSGAGGSLSRRSRARRWRRRRRCRSCIRCDRAADPALATSWRLAGVASHLRYTERDEKEQLDAVQAEIGRPEALARR